jgi:Flp pilus assembly protein TadG
VTGASTQVPPGPAAISAGPGRRRAHARRLASTERDRGTSPIELVILLPTIVLALFASIQVAVYFLARAQALAAAQEAVTAQKAYGAGKCDGHTAAADFLSRGDGGNWLSNIHIVVTPCDKPTDPNDPNGVTATITGSAPSLVFFWTVGVSATVHGTGERVTPAPSPSISQPPPGPPLPP